MMETIRFKNDTLTRKRLMVPASFAHPAKGQLGMWAMMIEKYSKPGDTVLDPMSGSGATLLAALMGRNVVCVELEPHFVDPMRRSWEKMRTMPMLGFKMGQAVILRGDARCLPLLSADTIITSPPYEGTNDEVRPFGGIKDPTANVRGMIGRHQAQQYTVMADVEREISNLCFDGVRGHPIDVARAAKLMKDYPLLYTRISDRERKLAHDEMNPMKQGYTRPPVADVVVTEYNSNHDIQSAAVGEHSASCSIHGTLVATQGRDRAHVQGNAAGGDSQLVRGDFGYTPKSDGFLGDTDEGQRPTWSGEWAIQGREAKSSVSNPGSQESVRIVRGHSAPDDSPSEQRPLRQPSGESSGDVQPLPPEPAQEGVVGSKESWAATSAIHCTCGLGQVAAIITSPPYANRVDDHGVDQPGWEGTSERFGRYTRKPKEGIDNDKGRKADGTGGDKHGTEGASQGNETVTKVSHETNYSPSYYENVGNQKGDAYWQSMKTIYAECWRVLRPGGILALVLKGFTRAGEYVDLPGQTEAMLLESGWVKHDEWRRQLWSLSFWRILQKRRSPETWDERLGYESVLAFRKPSGEGVGMDTVITSPPFAEQNIRAVGDEPYGSQRTGGMARQIKNTNPYTRSGIKEKRYE